MNSVGVRVPRAPWGVMVGVLGVVASLLVTATPADARKARHRHNHHARAAHGGYAPPTAAFVVDANTGRTLYAENEDAPRHPASVTKVMTLYLLFEALEKGRIALDTPLKISARAAAQDPSKLGLPPGSTIEVEDAIKAVVTKSCNDIAYAIAENLAGSEEAFAAQMTRKARSLGMSRTYYANASGLPNPRQITTARDLSLLARAIQERFPRQYRYFQTRTFNYAGRSMRNHNHLLGRVEGVDGIKTGFTRASGFNLMTSAKIGDRRLITIVLGGRSAAQRDQRVASLIQEHMPRAYAGNRTAPAIEERDDEPVAVAAADVPRRPSELDVEATASVRPSRAPMDIAPMRAAVATAANGPSTTTPSSMRWSTGAQPLPRNAQAFASADASAIEIAAPIPPSSAAKIEARLPAGQTIAALSAKADEPEPRREAARSEPVRAAAKPESSKAESGKSESGKSEAAKSEPSRTAKGGNSGWIIQLGALDDESKARSMLSDARSRSGRVLAGTQPFTEKVVRGGTTLYRARFSGFDEPDAAQEACKSLKRSGFSCFAARS